MDGTDPDSDSEESEVEVGLLVEAERMEDDQDLKVAMTAEKHLWTRPSASKLAVGFGRFKLCFGAFSSFGAVGALDVLALWSGGCLEQDRPRQSRRQSFHGGGCRQGHCQSCTMITPH